MHVVIGTLHDIRNYVHCAATPVMADVLHLRRPQIVVTGCNVGRFCMDEKDSVPHPVHHNLHSVSFVMIDQRPYLSPLRNVQIKGTDRTNIEQSAKHRVIYFGFDSQGNKCGLYTAGPVPVKSKPFHH